MNHVRSLAIFGGRPRFAQALALGQRNLPKESEYEAIFRDIFDRQYYTNQGPLVQSLEGLLSERLNVRHAICVTNEFIGLVIAAQALDVNGRVIVAAHGNLSTSQSLAWAKGKPCFCDVDAVTGTMTAELVAPLLTKGMVSAILASNPWGDACDVRALRALSDQYEVPLYIDSSHGFGCEVGGQPVGGLGAVEVISFHSGNIVGAGEGGVICTQDDELAARIRNIRSSYGMGHAVTVEKTANGRMSEGQAAMVLFNLEYFEAHRCENQHLFEFLRSRLSGVDGISVRVPQGVSRSNYQNLICLVDAERFGLHRDELVRVLRAENLLAGKGFALSGSLDAVQFPNAARYCSRTIEIPTRIGRSENGIEVLAALIGLAKEAAAEIREQITKIT